VLFLFDPDEQVAAQLPFPFAAFGGVGTRGGAIIKAWLFEVGLRYLAKSCL
jgi:hypothetical protein